MKTKNYYETAGLVGLGALAMLAIFILIVELWSQDICATIVSQKVANAAIQATTPSKSIKHWTMKD